MQTSNGGASLSVLVTRPKEQGRPLVDKLEALGIDALLLPALEIRARDLSPSERQSVESLDLYSHVICVSSNAATLGLELLSDYWPQWPVQQQWIAVGPATADAMQGWGLGEVLTPVGKSHSEGVLSLELLQELHDQKVLILRGVSGRELLADTLRQRGAAVDYLELYERIKPADTSNRLVNWLCSDCKKVIVVTSGDSLKNLLSMGQEPDQLSKLTSTTLVVVSQRLAGFAKEKGFDSVWVAEGASDEAIVHCIKANID